MSLLAAEKMQHASVHGALGKPKLIPGDPRAIVGLSLRDPAAVGTAMPVRLPRIEFQRRTILRTSPTQARELRLHVRERRRRRKEWLQVCREGVSEGRERALCRSTSLLQTVGIKEERHR
ncbi:MAG: hypothetical protein NVS1B4_16450 [Gemmatimonadaceae bacterium]